MSFGHMHNGKAKPWNCRCNQGLICGKCLSRAKPWFYTFDNPDAGGMIMPGYIPRYPNPEPETEGN